MTWSRDLEAALLRELSRSWRQINASLFKKALKPPSFELSDDGDRVGQWIRKTRQIRISRHLVLRRDWLSVLEVLKHEMAHQYAHEVLGAVDESAHGPAFRRVCAEHGIDGTAAGLLPVPEGREDRLVRRIRRLLALAGSPNRHEAEAAARKAYALMVEHNVRFVREADEVRFVVRQLGPVKQRFSAPERVLAGLLGSHFFVTPVWVPAFDVASTREGRALEVSGTLENVELATHVHAWLGTVGERLWNDWKKANDTRRDTERRRFLLGLYAGFRTQLDEQRVACAQTGLVWVGDPELDAFVGRRHPSLRQSRGVTYRPTEAWADGVAEGKRLKLHRPLHDQGSSGPGRRLIE